MKISFIDPPVLIGKRPPERVFGCTYGLYPIPNIFLLQVAAVLADKKYQVQYKNFPLNKINKEGFIEFLKNDSSDIYCIYSVNLAQQIDLEAFNIIRNINSKTKVIFFGPAPTYNPNQYLVDDNAIVVRGEPEITFSELIDAVNDKEKYDKIEGISFLKDGEVHNNPARQLNRDLDSLPFPDRTLLDSKKYFNPKFGKERFTAILTSRGCPYKCRYCVPCSLSFARELEYKNAHREKPRYITRSAGSVIEEFKLIKKQGYTAVSILDDEFLIDRKRLLEICRGIKDLGIKWGCLSRADSLTEESVREMKAAGCKYIDIGIESFSQRILDDIQKDLKVEAIGKAIELTKQYSIFTKINILFGSSPLEDEDTINETLRNIRRYKPDGVMFGICNPFPGTEYYNIAKNNNWFVKGDYYPIDVQRESTISLPNISKSKLESAIRKANMSFFLQPEFIFKNIKKIESPKELLNKVTVLMKKLF